MGDNRNSVGLRLDNVLTTQPELGPSVPDGGYGWVILTAAAFFQLTIPSLAISYGVFLMFTTLEDPGNDDNPLDNVWGDPLIYAPLAFAATWTIGDPLSRLVIANSRWPRLVGISGVCLTCAGLLLVWLAVINPDLLHSTLCFIGGSLSGMGAVLVMVQMEVLIAQYFRIKLLAVGVFLSVVTTLGSLLTPVFLGRYVNRNGLPHALIWYHLYVLTGTIVCILLKKPQYLKGGRSNYNPVRARHVSENEDEIFTKSATELRIARNRPSTSAEEPEVAPKVEVIKVDVHRDDWERFSDDEDDGPVNDLSLQAEFQNAPRELFTDLGVNNNTTYAFDDAGTIESNIDGGVFMPVLPTSDETWGFLLSPGFYADVYIQIVAKYTAFGFYALYPSFVYFGDVRLHKESISTLLGYVYGAGLFATALVRWVKIRPRSRALFLAGVSGLGCTGCFLISESSGVRGLIVGGIFLAMCIVAMEQLTEVLLKPSVKSEANRTYFYLNIISGVSLGILVPCRFSYATFFEMMGVMQLINALLWLCTYAYKRYKGID